jgi:hypothetical protein
MSQPSRTIFHVAYGGYVLLCLGALIWPLYAWAGARIEPRVFGLPFAFAWNLFWVLASFTALYLYDRALHGGRQL